MKKNAINENNISNKKNIKLNYFKSKSPPLKYKIIKTNVNTKGENIKNENESINNGFIKLIIIILKKIKNRIYKYYIKSVI